MTQGSVRAVIVAPAPSVLLATLLALLFAAASHAREPVAAQPNGRGAVEPGVQGDAISQPLSAEPGDAARGRLIVVNRQVGLCLLCHTGPFPEERFQGNLAPDLAGAGSRWSVGQLRLRVVDAQRLNPQTIMPAYHRTEGLTRVGAAWRDRPLLTAQQIEDVVAFLATLRE